MGYFHTKMADFAKKVHLSGGAPCIGHYWMEYSPLGFSLFGGGGGGIPDFKWQGWSNESKNQNPVKTQNNP